MRASLPTCVHRHTYAAEREGLALRELGAQLQPEGPLQHPAQAGEVAVAEQAGPGEVQVGEPVVVPRRDAPETGTPVQEHANCGSNVSSLPQGATNCRVFYSLQSTLINTLMKLKTPVSSKTTKKGCVLCFALLQAQIYTLHRQAAPTAQTLPGFLIPCFQRHTNLHQNGIQSDITIMIFMAIT
jgi:hypothetical protein